ncbi:MAG: tRNA pseudouridine(55) synthase TruB [Atopobiaceae bacterium]|nr:tRNA pseudouridine(55) synthase TruB [Atopobiaceae bacterium]
MKRGSSGINALIAIDKPLGMTSHDVVSCVRRAYGEKRVGHAGTLDPNASGVLVVGIGQATKLLGFLALDRKSYVADIVFGTRTSTDDADGEVIAAAPVPCELYDRSFARSTCKSLIGVQNQVPPAVSAISIKGKRAYQLVREGKIPELAERTIEIYSAELLDVQDYSLKNASALSINSVIWTVSFDVSKGTYIRSIARDLGHMLGTEAHIGALRRTHAGPVSEKDCISLDALQDRPLDALCTHVLNPIQVLGYPSYNLTTDEFAKVEVGQRFKTPRQMLELSDDSSVCLVRNNKLYGVWKKQDSYLVCQTNFLMGISCA